MPYCIKTMSDDAKIIGRSLRFFRKRKLRNELLKFKNKENLEEMSLFFEDFKKKDFKDADISDYSLRRDFGTLDHDRIFFADSNYQFVLERERKPIAVLGFESQLNAILVVQIQGIIGKQDDLKPIKWPNALLNLAVNWAQRTRINEVQVLPAERNKWGMVQGNFNGAKMYYDVTAKREGFKYDSERKVYRRIIN